MFKDHTPEALDDVISAMSKDLERLKKARKKRSDKGKKRSPYKAALPSRYRSYMNRANKKGIPFELSVDEFNIICRGLCVYCGTSSRIGVDRINSSDGYTIDNSQPCCGTCNIMKFTLSEEAFLKHLRTIGLHRRLWDR